MRTHSIILLSIPAVVGIISCAMTSASNTPLPLVMASATPASTLSELIEGLANDQRADVQIVSAYALADMGPAAEPAVPYLINNLQSQNSEVQISAIRALADIRSNEAVGPLTALLNNDFIQVRLEAVIALGNIGDLSAVPALAEALADEDTEVSAEAAKAIGKITGQQFPGIFDTGAFELNENGRPIAAVAAQAWWEQEGRYMDWSQQQE